ncbi:signal peptidase I [Microbacterium saperdae]|uniref:signal peptidase I n=1 Tax=Microbacterium saperdae TaxID=69368 RepID=UPI001E5F1AC4|nr:signal peptidase I [Microbacterium saperdae]
MTRRSLRVQSDPSDAPDAAAKARRGGPGRLIADVLLWIAAVGGVICIVLVVLALTAQITLIMFRTGSMSPTITAGSVAVVQRVPAADIAIGDVVTVDRVDELPITHRVTSVEPGASADERIITMRGDANTEADPFPYTVTSVRIVLFSIPGIATLIVGMGNPYVLGVLTLAATALVVWAFWPRADRSESRRRSDGIP